MATNNYDNYVNLQIPNVKVRWAKVHTPDEFKGSKKFKLEMYFETADEKKQADIYKAEGFNVREKKGDIILGASKDFGKAKHRNAAGEPCIKVVGPDGKTPFLEDLGNGTLCNIKVTAKKWDVSNTVTLYLEEIQVVKHVVYEGGGFADVTDGNSIGV